MIILIMRCLFNKHERRTVNPKLKEDLPQPQPSTGVTGGHGGSRGGHPHGTKRTFSSYEFFLLFPPFSLVFKSPSRTEEKGFDKTSSTS